MARRLASDDGQSLVRARFGHPFAEDATQSTARASRRRTRRHLLYCVEVSKPASQGPVQILTDGFETSPIRSSGLLSDCVFEFVHAFLSRPFHTPFKMIP